VKQSKALAKEIQEKANEARPPYEISIEQIEIRFRSHWRKRLFPWFALFFIPFAQGRLRWLRFFISRGSVKALERMAADLVISAGASLVPLNLCAARENLAKSAVVMKPSFPFNLFRYDLALIPAHDRGFLPRGSLRIQRALTSFDPELLGRSKEALSRSIRDPMKIRLSVFLGGETRNFTPTISQVESFLQEIECASEKLKGDFLITTSRRTPEVINRFLRERLAAHPRCQLCVIAREDGRPEVVPGMIALADFLLVTEDSLSMISEALSSGKKVVVVKMRANGVSRKHNRFHEILKRDWGIPVVEISKISEALREGEIRDYREQILKERNRICERLEALL